MVMDDEMETKLIPTLNNMGWMAASIGDPYTREFIEYSATAARPVMEIGAAYGVAAASVLRSGGRIIVNDLDPHHLHVLYEQTPQALREQLHLMPGSCVDGIEVAEGSVSAILCARVFHFFDSSMISTCLNRFHRWLAPGGKIFIVADSVFHGMNQEIYPDFLVRKAAGHPTPGWVSLKNNQRLEMQKNREEIQRAMPEYFNFLDLETLAPLFKDAGFLVESAGYFNPEYYYDVSLWDGREGVGMVGLKAHPIDFG